MESNCMFVCARADSPLAVAGSTFDKFCKFCGERVMVAPSGQDFLKANPKAEICCSVCFEANTAEVDEVSTCPLEQLAREVAAAIPNKWRERN